MSFERLKALNAETKRVQDEADKLVRDAVLDAARIVFAQHPKVKSFSVHGYHPSFNDGDPCSFRFCSDAFSINGCPSPGYGGEESEMEDAGMTPADWDRGREYRDGEIVQVREPGFAAAADKTIGEVFAVFTNDQMERAFDSNFELWFSRGPDGAVKVEKEYYDCGY